MTRTPIAAAMLLIASALGAALSPAAFARVSASEATLASATIVVPEPFPAGIPVDGASIGAPDAPVTVVVWSDYTCPGCKRFALETLPRLVTEFAAPGAARFVSRDYAFRGPEALRAADAAACAADQGAFWPFHATLFLNQSGPGSFSDARLLEMARSLALDTEVFGACLEHGDTRGAVERSIAEARARGIDSVPTLFVNGEEVDAWDDVNEVGDAITRALDLELRQPNRAATPATGSAPPAPTTVGLDLVFEMRPPGDGPLDPQSAVAIRATLERRMDALGLTGGVWRRAGNRILVRVDATDAPARVVHALATPALLELIDPQGTYLAPGTIVATTLGAPESPTGAAAATDPVYETIVSGADLGDLYATTGGDGVTPAIGFEMLPDAAGRLYDYTSSHVGQPLSIALDKVVVSSPVITGAIAGEGIIEGIPSDEVADLVLLLESGALAVPLELLESRTIAAPAPVATPVP